MFLFCKNPQLRNYGTANPPERVVFGRETRTGGGGGGGLPSIHNHCFRQASGSRSCVVVGFLKNKFKFSMFQKPTTTQLRHRHFVRRRGGFRTCRGRCVHFAKAKRAFLVPRLELAVSRLLLPHLAASLRFQKCRKRKDHSLKKFSGFRLARQDTQCLFSTTPVNKSSPQALKTHAFLGVPGNSSRAAQEASETAPRGQVPQALRPAPKRQT